MQFRVPPLLVCDMQNQCGTKYCHVSCHCFTDADLAWFTAHRQRHARGGTCDHPVSMGVDTAPTCQDRLAARGNQSHCIRYCSGTGIYILFDYRPDWFILKFSER
jgi:hypothetical protein